MVSLSNDRRQNRPNTTSLNLSLFHSRAKSTIVCALCFALLYSGWFITTVRKIHPELFASINGDKSTILSSFTSTTNSAVLGQHNHDDDDGSNEVSFNSGSHGMDPKNAQKLNINSKVRIQVKDFQFHRNNAERMASTYSQQKESGGRRMKTLSAYMEKAMNDSIPGTEDQGNEDKYIGMPPEFIIPLPLRTTTPHDLIKFEYPKLDSCHDHQAKLPVDRGLVIDKNGNRVWNNLGNKHDLNYDVYEEAKTCPVDADPWLPWIHDIFPNGDGKIIHILAQNKRRCRSSVRYKDLIKRMEPQVAMMQHVSVKRLEEGDIEAEILAPELWSPKHDSDAGVHNDQYEVVDDMPRYRLAPMEESDDDGQFTRFICRFHTMEVDSTSGQLRDVIVGETLSTFPANYELASWRKRSSSMITPRGKDNAQFWLSSFQFDCPVPNNGNIQSAIASGESVLDDGTPSIYLDIVPMRTSPRFGTTELYLPDWMTGMHERPYQGESYEGWDKRLGNERGHYGFNATRRWGDKNILPRVEASGRWANLPICAPPKIAEKSKNLNNIDKGKKPHTLAACLWASASFHTRGNARTVTDTTTRLQEWVEFHLLAGFDHIYVYDNTGAHTNQTSLEETLSIFKSSEVTRINWPFEVCNNNIPAHQNTGERSSQYAAEASCLKRFGPYSEWMGSFDTDEYLVPMGEHTSLKDVVNKAHEGGSKILSFRSTRAYPDIQFTEPSSDHKACGTPEEPKCRVKRANETFLETYNCDEFGLPKPEWAIRAKKQLYRPDQVYSHFVHYATITKALMETYKEVTEDGKNKKKWRYHYVEDPTERYTNELEEAVMLHTKTTPIEDTAEHDPFCKLEYSNAWGEKCRVAFHYPENVKIENATNDDGFEYNCVRNEKVEKYWGPRLREAMKKRSKVVD